MKGTKKNMKLSKIDKKSNIKRKYSKKLRGGAKISNKKYNFKRRKYTKKLRGGVANLIANPRLLTGSGDDTEINPTDIAPTDIAPTDVAGKLGLFEGLNIVTRLEQLSNSANDFEKIKDFYTNISCAIYNFFNKYTKNFMSPVPITTDDYIKCITPGLTPGLSPDKIKEIYCKNILRTRLFIEIILIFYNLFPNKFGINKDFLDKIFVDEEGDDQNKYTKIFVELDKWSLAIIGIFNKMVTAKTLNDKFSNMKKQLSDSMTADNIMKGLAMLSPDVWVLGSLAGLTVGGIGLYDRRKQKKKAASRNKLLTDEQIYREAAAAAEKKREKNFEKKFNTGIKSKLSKMFNYKDKNKLINKIKDMKHILEYKIKSDSNLKGSLERYQLSYRYNMEFIFDTILNNVELYKTELEKNLDSWKNLDKKDFLEYRNGALIFNIYLSLIFRKKIEIFLPDLTKIKNNPFKEVDNGKKLIVPCHKETLEELKFDSENFKKSDNSIVPKEEVIFLMKFNNIPSKMPEKELANLIPNDCQTSKCVPGKSCKYPDSNFDRLKSAWKAIKIFL